MARLILSQGGALRDLASQPARSKQNHTVCHPVFNSSEKRLARVLLLMAHFGKEGKSETIIAKISQEMLAEMIGTTRCRVSFFLNRFRKLGFLDYSGDRVHVHSSLLNIVLHD